MNFLKDLILWFFRGSSDNNPAENTARSEAPAAEPRTESKTQAKTDKKPVQKPLDVVGSILAESQPDAFLKELQSLTPMKKQFDKDQADLQKEVKRLAGWKKRA